MKYILNNKPIGNQESNIPYLLGDIADDKVSNIILKVNKDSIFKNYPITDDFICVKEYKDISELDSVTPKSTDLYIPIKEIREEDENSLITILENDLYHTMEDNAFLMALVPTKQEIKGLLIGSENDLKLFAPDSLIKYKTIGKYDVYGMDELSSTYGKGLNIYIYLKK